MAMPYSSNFYFPISLLFEPKKAPDEAMRVGRKQKEPSQAWRIKNPWHYVECRASKN